MSSDKRICGMCLHYKQHAHPSQGTVCSKLGIKHYRNAPRCFTPDVSRLAESHEMLAQIAQLFGTMDAKQKRIMMAVLSTPVKKQVLPLGQLVYFRAVGQDYVDNYLSGYVMAYTSTGQIAVMGSPEVRRYGRVVVAYLSADSVMLPDEWYKHKSSLINANRMHDPREPMKFKKPTVDIDYEPPTLDKSPKEWQENNLKRQPKRKPADGGVDLTIQIVG